MRIWLAVVIAFLLIVGTLDAQLQLPIFRPAVQLSSTLVNSSFTDYAPSITGDNLTLYWTSSRTGGPGAQDVWMVTRADLNSPWTNAMAVTSLCSPLAESYIDVRDDDLEMVLSTTRTGGVGGTDLWISTRPSTTAPWGAPVLLPGMNSTLAEDDPSITGDGLELYFCSGDTSKGGQGTTSIYRITRSSLTAPWSTIVTYVKELDSTAQDHSPSISADGLTMIWASLRTPGTGSSDLYIATRPDRVSQFTNVQELVELNTIGWEHNGQWSADGFSYYYTQNGNNMIWRADRILPLCIVDGTQPFGPGVQSINLGQTMTVSCRRDPGDVGVIVGALSSIPPTPLPGIQGNLELNLGTMFIPPMINFVRHMGRYSLPFAIPNDKRLSGLRLHFQVAAQDQGVPPLVYLSNRAEVLIL